MAGFTVPGQPQVPPRFLGRDTAASINAMPTWSALVAPAPHFFAGTSDSVEVSPPIYDYCPGGFDNQWIGECVGKGSKNAVATLLRIPPGAVFDAAQPSRNSRPMPTFQLSGLYCYLNARRKGIELGHPIRNRPNDPRGGGAVVAFSLLAMAQHGVVLDTDYPDTQADQLRCSDAPLPAPLYAKGARHLVLKGARITSRQQYLDYLAQGFPVVDGVPITEGWLHTDAAGLFTLDGAVVGGHCTMKCGYDKKLDRLYTRNSWMQWGARTADPEFQGAAAGYSNVGHCSLQRYCDRHLTAAAFASGETDAFVLTVAPDGFARANIAPASNVAVFA